MRLRLAALLFAANAAHAAEPPRLTGTLIGPGERVALFATGSGGTTQAALGEPVADYVVRAIDPGRVELEQGGRRVVVSLEAAAAPMARDTGAVTFGLVLRTPGPADD